MSLAQFISLMALYGLMTVGMSILFAFIETTALHADLGRRPYRSDIPTGRVYGAAIIWGAMNVLLAPIEFVHYQFLATLLIGAWMGIIVYTTVGVYFRRLPRAPTKE